MTENHRFINFKIQLFKQTKPQANQLCSFEEGWLQATYHSKASINLKLSFA